MTTTRIAIDESYSLDVPQKFIDNAFTFDVMKVPVIATDTNTYEANDLIAWLSSGSAQSPYRNNKLEKTVIFNFQLYQEIRDFFINILEREYKSLHQNDKKNALKYIMSYAQGLWSLNQNIIDLLENSRKAQVTIYGLVESLPKDRIELNIDPYLTLLKYPISVQVRSIAIGTTFFNVMQLVLDSAIPDLGSFERIIVPPSAAFALANMHLLAEFGIGLCMKERDEYLIYSTFSHCSALATATANLGLAFIPGMPTWAPPLITTLASTLILPKVYEQTVLAIRQCKQKNQSDTNESSSCGWFNLWNRSNLNVNRQEEILLDVSAYRRSTGL